jgi:hypothetical protein
MKGDFSRFTFDPSKHYSGVLHQQGRVWLDSDWNEEVLERLALLQQELADVIGPAGVPAAGSGFELSPSADPNAPDDFAISEGHCYVNGILCQIDANTSYLSQPDLLNPPRITLPRDGSTVTALVYLEVWQRLITYLEDDSIREIALGGPDTSARLKNIVQVKAKVLPPQQGPVTCAQGAQFLPTSGRGTLTTLQPTNVQPQNLCQLPDPANFTGRENHLYRVQVHDGGDVAGGASSGAFSVSLAGNVAAGATSLGVTPALTAAQSNAALRNGFITLSDKSGLTETVPLAPDGVSGNGTALTLAQGLKNAFTTGNSTTVTGGIARFKWSRDNAAFAVNVTDVQQDRVTLTLASLGRDVATALRDGDLVEISDDASELGPGRGHLTTLAGDPDPDKFRVVLSDPVPSSFVLPNGTSSPPSPSSADRHMVLRRWDQVGDAASTYSDAGTPGMNLGDGVHIQFGGQELCAGDYWQFTARAADGSVQSLLNAPPAGINRSWAPLAIVSWGPPAPSSPPAPAGSLAMTIVQSCLPTFPALINFPPIDQGIHIVALSTVDANNNATPLVNDSNVQVNTFAGINVQCDTNVDPASISRPTCFVTVEFPVNFGGQGADAYYPIVLAGNVSCSGNVISWMPGNQAQTVLNQLISAALTDRGLLTHLTLKGDFIWSQNDPTLFLDGEVFGRPPGGNNKNVSLRLPSGDRRRGGDFEMWFWVVAAPSFITDVQATPSGPINTGDAVTLTMTLSSQAPANSVITLTLSNANVSIANEKASSPPTSPPSFTVPVPVPIGATSVTVTATGVAVGSTNVTAMFGQTVAITLVVQPAPQLTGQLVLSPASVFVGRNATGTVTITGPAPSKGLTVNLISSNPGVGKLAVASVTVPAGSTTASFQITGVAVGTCTVTASTTNPASSLAALFTVVQKQGKEIEKVKLEKVQLEKVVETKLVTEKLKTFDMISGNFADRALLVQGLAASQPLLSPEALPQRAAFIRAEERPPVGEAVLNPPAPEEPRLDASTTADTEVPPLALTDATPAVDLPLPKQKSADKALSPEKGPMPEKLGGRPTR